MAARAAPGAAERARTWRFCGSRAICLVLDDLKRELTEIRDAAEVAQRRRDWWFAQRWLRRRPDGLRRQQVGCRADRLHRRRSGAGAGGGRRDRRPDRRGAQEGEVGLADVGRDGGRGAAAVPRLPAAERDGAAIGLVVGLGLGGLARTDRPERAAPDAEHGAGRPVRLPVAALRLEGDGARPSPTSS